MTAQWKLAIENHMADLHRGWRSQLRAHFKLHKGEEDKNYAKQFPHPDVQDSADWNWLCDFGSEKQLVSNIFLTNFFFHVYIT